MNLPTAILCIVFFVALGSVVVAQQLGLRSVRYDLGVQDRELRKLDEELRVLRVQLAKERDPKAMFARAAELKCPVLPPEQPDKPAETSKPPKPPRRG